MGEQSWTFVEKFTDKKFWDVNMYLWFKSHIVISVILWNIKIWIESIIFIKVNKIFKKYELIELSN